MNDKQAKDIVLPEHLDEVMRSAATEWRARAAAGGSGPRELAASLTGGNSPDELAALLEEDPQGPQGELASFSDTSSAEALKLHATLICHLVTSVAVGAPRCTQEAIDLARSQFSPFDLGSNESRTTKQFANFSLLVAAFNLRQSNWDGFARGMFLFARLCHRELLGGHFLTIVHAALAPTIDQATIEKYKYVRRGSSAELIELSDDEARAAAIDGILGNPSEIQSLGAWANSEAGATSSRFNLLVCEAYGWLTRNGPAYLAAVQG